jgi:glycosyltransferase involved in cell wall biosynthesis
MPSSSSESGLREPSRLIILAQYVDAAENSTGYYWSKIIRGMAREFDQVCVICPESSFRRVADPPERVVYLPFKDGGFNKNKLGLRLLGQSIQSLHIARALLSKVRRGDAVFTGTNPALSIYFISLVKRFRAFRWALLVHDVFPENLISAGVVGKRGILYRILKRSFDRAYRSPDVLIAIGRDMRELLAQKTGNNANVVFVPNWVDPADVAPKPRDSSGLLAGRGWKDRVVFQFFGNLGRVQGVENMLNALGLVKSARASFIFIGSGARSGVIARFIAEHPHLEVALVPGLPFADNNAGLSACDVAIVSLGSGMKGLAVPSKAYFSLAADKPLLVVSEEGSELHLLLEEEESIGWFCRCEDPVALAGMIDAICDLDLGKLAGKPRRVAVEKFGSAAAIGQYARFIREMTS